MENKVEKIIRKIIREELQNMSVVLASVLSESLTMTLIKVLQESNTPLTVNKNSNGVITENSPKTPSNSLRKMLYPEKNNKPVKKQPKASVFKNGDGKVLFNILNQTADEMINESPDERSIRDAGQIEVTYNQQRRDELLQELGMDLPETKHVKVQLPQTTASGKIVNPNDVPSDLIEAFTKDYSSMLKNMDKEAKKYRAQG